MKNAEYQLLAAREAFHEVVRQGQPAGWLNVARTYIADRRFDQAAQALEKARPHRAELAHWTFDWLAGTINLENGYLDEAIDNFESAMKPTGQTKARGFDFSQDYRLLNELATAYFERSKQARGESNRELRQVLLAESRRLLKAVLGLIQKINVLIIRCRWLRHVQAMRRRRRFIEGPTKPINETTKRENRSFRSIGVTTRRPAPLRKLLLSTTCIAPVLRGSRGLTLYSKASRYSKTASNLVAISGSKFTRLASQWRVSFRTTVVE